MTTCASTRPLARTSSRARPSPTRRPQPRRATQRASRFYLIDAPDLDTLVDWCRILPHGYTIEIRPCVAIDLPG